MNTWDTELAKIATVEKTAKMIDANTIEKAMKTKGEAERITKSEMPSATFVFKGLDDKKVYFNVVSKKATEQQIKDIKEKTRFGLIKETTSPIYKGEFWINIM